MWTTMCTRKKPLYNQTAIDEAPWWSLEINQVDAGISALASLPKAEFYAQLSWYMILSS